MYSACISCNKSLGKNEVVETFPIGSRLAFDEAKGRLWAICPACRRWNLTPLEERWEAIEECARIFPTLKGRVHTPQVGAARHPSGLGLVRIGKPLPEELGSWRYADVMGARWRRTKQLVVAGTALAGAISVAGAASGIISGFALGSIVGNAPSLLLRSRIPRARTAVRLKGGPLSDEHGLKKIRLKQIDLLNPTKDEPFALRVRQGDQHHILEGDAARNVIAKVVPHFNLAGAARRHVREAVGQLSDAGGAENYLRATWGSGKRRPGNSTRWPMTRDREGTPLMGLMATESLTYEMALYQGREELAMRGEVRALELAWKEAELIANISDNLLTPTSVPDRLRKLRGQDEP